MPGWAAKERQIEVREQPQEFVAHSGRKAVRRGAQSMNDLAEQLDRSEAALRELAPDGPRILSALRRRTQAWAVRRHLAEFLGRCKERGAAAGVREGELEAFAGCDTERVRHDRRWWTSACLFRQVSRDRLSGRARVPTVPLGVAWARFLGFTWVFARRRDLPPRVEIGSLLVHFLGSPDQSAEFLRIGAAGWRRIR